MYGDFSRMTYSPGKAYTGVWSQQGRVQLDADANEQTAILLDWLRTLAIDFIGPFGGHVKRAGFHVDVNGSDLTFSPGHYYVYGLRCEVPEPAGPDDPAATYRGLVPAASALPVLVQLLVWERSVSAVTDADLLEPALGPYPPDTTVRTQVAWIPMVSSSLPAPAPDGTPLADVKAADLNSEYIAANFEEYNARGRTLPLLTAGVGDNEGEEMSIMPATSGYLGVENQLYRLEVHVGGTVAAGNPTFKWSRDNGCAEFRVVAIETEETDGKRAGGKNAPDPVVHVTVASLGRDGRNGLEAGDWVELIDDTWMPQGTPAPLLAVRAIDRAGRIVTLGGELATDLSLHPYLRRWDQTSPSPEGTPIVESSADGEDDIWLQLEDGVQVRFSANGAEYRTGDYWLIPARTATGGVLWPGGIAPRAVPPHGPTRYLVPLALVTAKDTAEDIRVLFTHLAWPDPGDQGGKEA
jgi:hypothetical protein